MNKHQSRILPTVTLQQQRQRPQSPIIPLHNINSRWRFVEILQM